MNPTGFLAGTVVNVRGLRARPTRKRDRDLGFAVHIFNLGSAALARVFDCGECNVHNRCGHFH